MIQRTSEKGFLQILMEQNNNDLCEDVPQNEETFKIHITTGNDVNEENTKKKAKRKRKKDKEETRIKKLLKQVNQFILFHSHRVKNKQLTPTRMLGVLKRWLIFQNLILTSMELGFELTICLLLGKSRNSIQINRKERERWR